VVPGAGLEPARTLPDPRDFKSTTYYHQQTVAGRKALYQRGFPRWHAAYLLLTASWFSYSVSYSTPTVEKHTLANYDDDALLDSRLRAHQAEGQVLVRGEARGSEIVVELLFSFARQGYPDRRLLTRPTSLKLVLPDISLVIKREELLVDLPFYLNHCRRRDLNEFGIASHLISSCEIVGERYHKLEEGSQTKKCLGLNNRTAATTLSKRIAAGLQIPCAFVSSDNGKAFHAV